MAINELHPLNDAHMKYDLVKRRYILTPDGVFFALNIRMENANMTIKDAERLLDRQSLQIYNFIKQHTANTDAVKWKRYFMAKDDELREVIFEALVGQIEYYFASAGSLIALQTGVSIEKAKVIPLFELRGKRRIAEMSETTLEVSGLLYTGYYNRYRPENEDGTF
jgi:hypothetical protein